MGHRQNDFRAQSRPTWTRGHVWLVVACICCGVLLRPATAGAEVWVHPLAPGAGTSSAPPFPFGPSTGTMDEAIDSERCSADVVQAANVAQLYPILHELQNTTFFRMFRVGKNPNCSYWKKPGDDGKISQCEGGKNDGFAVQAQKIAQKKGPAFGKQKKSLKADKPKEADAPCGLKKEDGPRRLDIPAGPDIRLDRSNSKAEKLTIKMWAEENATHYEFEEDRPMYFGDMITDEYNNGAELEYINLVNNAERNTGYNGSHIWTAFYKENCFEIGAQMPRGSYGSGSDMCYEERVLYRLISGWQAVTTISIYKSYFAPGTRLKGAWAPNPQKYMQSLGRHQDRVQNIHYSFVVMLRALKKASSFLHNYPFPEGEGQEAAKTKKLVSRLLDSQVLSMCTPLFEAFDETRLFKDTKSQEERAAAKQRSELKRTFKKTFKNITNLVDCVSCQRCRLHAKVFTLGIGTGLKILLTPEHHLSHAISHDEVVALINTIWKISEAMEDSKYLTKLYWEEQGQAESAAPAKQAAPPVKPPPQPQATAPRTASTPPAATAAPIAPSGDLSREALLDYSIGAIKRAASAGQINNELEVLRSLVLKQPSTEVLVLGKHYAADRPDLFASLAIEAAAAGNSFQPAKLGSTSSPPDAIVIGGGLAGMAAALSIIDRGGKVVMIEKQAFLGGNSGKASSGINAALISNTTVESLAKDTTKSAGVLARPNLINKLAGDSAQAVSWLRDRTGVDLSQVCQLGGHTAERTLRPNNAFVGAEVTFAIGQILEKIAKEKPDTVRLMLKTKFKTLDRVQGTDRWKVIVQGTKGDAAEEVIEGPSVVIASGGFGYDVEELNSYLMKYRPDLKEFATTLGPQTTGEGIKIAEKIGADLVDMDRVQLHPTGFVNPEKPTDHQKTLAAEVLRGAGGLLLTRKGGRFTDELGTRQAVVNAMLKVAKDNGNYGEVGETGRHFYMVLNGKAAIKLDRHVPLYNKKGLLTKVQGLDGVAQHMGVTKDVLQRTFEAYNEAAKLGKDSFNRTIFPTHWPIEWNEEFYVGKVTPVIHYTMGGIAIDPDGKVLDKAGKVFGGLYAIGEASGGVHGDNRLAGNSLLECTVFGRHVGVTLPIAPPQAQMPAQVQQPARAAEPPAVQPVAAQADLKRQFSKKELKETKKTKGQHILSLYGEVYDLSDYVDDHPGGAHAITDAAGTDATSIFETVHNKALLESIGFQPIGELAKK